MERGVAGPMVRLQRIRKAGMAAMLTIWLSGCAEAPTAMDLRTFDKPEATNHFLVCDPVLCRSVPDLPAPRFVQSPERLGAALREVLRDESRLTLTAGDNLSGQWIYVQRSAVFRFPDAIWVQVIPLPDGGSTLALYSRSRYGRYDFGVNEARLRRWLSAITAVLAG